MVRGDWGPEDPLTDLDAALKLQRWWRKRMTRVAIRALIRINKPAGLHSNVTLARAKLLWSRQCFQRKTLSMQEANRAATARSRQARQGRPGMRRAADREGNTLIGKAKAARLAWFVAQQRDAIKICQKKEDLVAYHLQHLDPNCGPRGKLVHSARLKGVSASLWVCAARKHGGVHGQLYKDEFCVVMDKCALALTGPWSSNHASFCGAQC